MTDQPDPGCDLAEFTCGRCGMSIYARTQDALIRLIARHKPYCAPIGGGQ